MSDHTKLLADVAVALDGVTPGPWWGYSESQGGVLRIPADGPDRQTIRSFWLRLHDVCFIYRARELVPQLRDALKAEAEASRVLTDEARRLRGELERAKTELAEAQTSLSMARVFER